MSSTPTVDEIMAKFPMRNINPMRGEPTYDSITSLKADLFANAAVIPTTLGGGQHGHLGLVMKDQLYQTLSGTVFIVPPDPGPLPLFNPNRTYTAALCDYDVNQCVRLTDFL